MRVLIAALAAFVLGPATAAQAGLHKEFAIFSDCPVNTPGVTSCIVSTTTSGEFKIGSKTVPINKTVLLQGGLKTGSPDLVPAADGNTLSKTALQLPGGLVGLEVLPPLTEVTATAELAGTAEINPTNANAGTGVAASLPLKVKLDNPLLGGACYIGSDSEPITPQLTTGTTNPPAPTTPISGSPGKVSIGAHGKIITVENSSLVDNAFSAPGANGCGVLPLTPLVVDPAVDLVAGLPSAAGNNRAILNGNLAAASVRSVLADRELPELGRCVKAEGHKEGKVVVYNGGYTDAGCVEENQPHQGKYEWHVGAAAGKFTASSGTASLETVGKAKIKCASSTSEGEYTGAKTANVSIKFSGCKNARGEACQSGGAEAGQLLASGLAAQLGFIKDVEQGGEFLPSVGWDVARSPALIAAECGASKEALEVTGSVIAPVSALDKMTSAYTLKYAQVAGKQNPESFEEEPNDTLSARIGSGSAEQAGLQATDKVTNAEKLEIKAEAEE